jgi:hypothetical protein
MMYGRAHTVSRRAAAAREGTGILAFFATWAVIPRIAAFTLRGGFSGKDLCKKHLPEAETLMCAKRIFRTRVCTDVCMCLLLPPSRSLSLCMPVYLRVCVCAFVRFSLHLSL